MNTYKKEILKLRPEVYWPLDGRKRMTINLNTLANCVTAVCAVIITFKIF